MNRSPIQAVISFLSPPSIISPAPNNLHEKSAQGAFETESSSLENTEAPAIVLPVLSPTCRAEKITSATILTPITSPTLSKSPSGGQMKTQI